MVSYVMESRKGRRSLVALLAALAVAIFGAYLVTMSTLAKPAEAVTTCDPFAVAPVRLESLEYKSVGYIQCNGGYVKEMAFRVELQRRNADGGWSRIKYEDYYSSEVRARGERWVFHRFCTLAGTPGATYRTVVKNGFTRALNGTPHYYSPVYSRPVFLAGCAPG